MLEIVFDQFVFSGRDLGERLVIDEVLSLDRVELLAGEFAEHVPAQQPGLVVIRRHRGPSRETGHAPPGCAAPRRPCRAWPRSPCSPAYTVRGARGCVARAGAARSRR